MHIIVFCRTIRNIREQWHIITFLAQISLGLLLINEWFCLSKANWKLMNKNWICKLSNCSIQESALKDELNKLHSQSSRKHSGFFFVCFGFFLFCFVFFSLSKLYTVCWTVLQKFDKLKSLLASFLSSLAVRYLGSRISVPEKNIFWHYSQ